MDPITQDDLEVTIFLSQDSKNYYLETNSKTNNRYIFKYDELVLLESNEESLSKFDIYESDTFN